MVDELGKVEGLEVVDQPGPGVARLRLAITGLNASKGWVNAGLKVGVTVAGGVGLLIPSVDVGGVAMEGEVLDSETNHRLVAFRDKKRGRRMFNFQSYKKWGDAKKAFRKWADLFGKTMAQARTERPGSADQ